MPFLAAALPVLASIGGTLGAAAAPVASGLGAAATGIGSTLGGAASTIGSGLSALPGEIGGLFSSGPAADAGGMSLEGLGGAPAEMSMAPPEGATFAGPGALSNLSVGGILGGAGKAADTLNPFAQLGGSLAQLGGGHDQSGPMASPGLELPPLAQGGSVYPQQQQGIMQLLRALHLQA